MRLLRILALMSLVVLGVVTPRNADAQYKNGQFGFEAGYLFVGEDALLEEHGFVLGLRGAYKLSDRWWLSARGMVSFRGDAGARDNTAVLFHLVPADVRYYFETDAFRPFVGITNSFQFLFNQEIDSDVFWGPGGTGGVEIRLKRDLFLGFQLDAFWMFVFEGPDAPLVTLTSQLIFFL